MAVIRVNQVMCKVPIVLFFDDGYREDLTIAEILKAYNIKATFAITVKNIGKELNRYDLQVLARTGEIASHGLLHINLAKLAKINTALVYRELKYSKTILEGLINQAIETFVYPYGSYNGILKKLVAKVGYKAARTLDILAFTPGNDFYAIPITMADSVPNIKQVLRSFHLIPSHISNLTTLVLYYKYLIEYNPFRLMQITNVLKIMYHLLKTITSKCHSNLSVLLSVLLVFHSRNLVHRTLNAFRSIIDYIHENETFKPMTFSEYIKLIQQTKGGN